MLKTFADAVRHRGPAGALFVVMMSLLPVIALAPHWLGSLLENLADSAERYPMPAGLLLLALAALVAKWVDRLRRQRAEYKSARPISEWPKLGRDDQHAIRSKLRTAHTPKK